MDQNTQKKTYEKYRLQIELPNGITYSGLFEPWTQVDYDASQAFLRDIVEGEKYEAVNLEVTHPNDADWPIRLFLNKEQIRTALWFLEVR
tara:strand:- start:5639 stop:5908 length:270 start_codon:yes stop_codon:yes gene_type:complete